MSRPFHRLAHIVIVVAYTVFCVSGPGIEHPVARLVVAILSGLPMLWAIGWLARRDAS